MSNPTDPERIQYNVRVEVSRVTRRTTKLEVSVEIFEHESMSAVRKAAIAKAIDAAANLDFNQFPESDAVDYECGDVDVLPLT